MQRLTEPECEILELLQKAQPTDVNKGSIMATIGSRNFLVNKCLDSLKRRNYISEKQEYGFTYYFISDSNRQVKARNVICPKCKNTRRVFSNTQIIARCKNPECTTPTGKRTVFWVIKRSVKLQNGQIVHLNQA